MTKGHKNNNSTYENKSQQSMPSYIRLIAAISNSNVSVAISANSTCHTGGRHSQLSKANQHFSLVRWRDFVEEIKFALKPHFENKIAFGTILTIKSCTTLQSK